VVRHLKIKPWQMLMLLGATLIVGVVGGYALARLADSGGGGAGVECESATGQTSTSSARKQAVPKRWAPLVLIDPHEGYRPLPVDCFIAHSRLDWAKGSRRDELAGSGEVDASKLGHGEYSETVTDAACSPEQPCVFNSRSHTRPYDGDRLQLRGRQGFYLDVDNHYRVGTRGSTDEGPIFTGTPVYYEFVNRRFVTYWFFYGFSAPAALAYSGGFNSAAHEGDWERISVRLDSTNSPLGVAYFEHGGAPLILPWSSVSKLDGHPVVFSAQGSHASYPREDVYPDNFDRTRAGLIWATWDEIADVRKQSWYGFGGAWGRVGRVKDLTGPLGPSRYKRPAPCEWTPGCR
jgi:hypothetical protein